MKRFFATRWAMVVLVAIFLAASSGLVARAIDNHPYTLFYPEDSEKALRTAALDGGIGDNDVKGPLAQTYMITKGGRMGTQKLSLDADKSNKYDMPIYSLQYYCVISSNVQNFAEPQITTQKPPDTYEYASFTLGVGVLDKKDWRGLTTQSSYKTRVGVLAGSSGDISDKAGEWHKPEKTSDPDPSNWTQEENHTIRVKDDTNGMYKNLQGIDIDNNSPPAWMNKCLPDPKGDIGSQTSNYQKLSDENKKDWDQKVKDAGLGDTVADIGSSLPDDSSDTNQSGTNCQGGGMGWLFCPMIQAMASTVQLAANLIDELMQVRFLAQDGPSKQVETAWRAFLSVANIALVIAFMFIIFSQATSAGLSNYGIKRMLPRLIIAAILMNLSFYICAFAIDISNILGSSIMGFLVGSGNSVSSSVTAATGGTGAAGILGWLAAGVAIIALAFFLFIPVVLSIIIVLITLIGRQVILICLVLVSPLAFVAWLLPNTEKWFKKWSETFFQLLLLYPMIMLMFGAALYLSNLIGNPDLGTSIIGG